MDERRYTPDNLGRRNISIGKEGTSGALRIVFDCAAWLAEYPGGVVTLHMQMSGGITTSPIAPPSSTEYDTRYRLIADEGMALTDGTNVTTCTDTDDPLIWTEIPAPEEEDADETAEKAQAYDILTGGIV